MVEQKRIIWVKKQRVETHANKANMSDVKSPSRQTKAAAIGCRFCLPGGHRKGGPGGNRPRQRRVSPGKHRPRPLRGRAEAQPVRWSMLAVQREFGALPAGAVGSSSWERGDKRMRF